MADKEPKRSGLRAMFGMRSSQEPGSRRKLSKKGLGSDAALGKLDSTITVNPRRQDSGSYTSGSIALNREDMAPPTYELVAGLSNRDDAYSGASVVPGTNIIYQQSHQDLAEYRRNSEGQQQYASPFYDVPNSRSASVPQVQGDYGERKPQLTGSTKASAARLSKKYRGPTRADDILDKDTGERKDLTDMMHAFTYNEALDTVEENTDRKSADYDPSKPDGTATLGSASPEVWLQVADFLSPLDVANLSSTCRTLCARLGRQPYKLLINPANRPHRLDFLLEMDHKLPRHLFCFPCAQWHLRIQPGLETLKPHNVLNPLFECPNRTNMHLPPPRIRITDGRTLPFAFVQLARRSWAFGPEFGITHQSLARRWKEPHSGWTHETMYHVTDKGHVLMRVKSQHYVEGGMTDAGKRMLLFSREDYTPYFSVCSHWKNGLLTSIPKCALDHIPFATEANTYAALQLRDKAVGRKATGIVHLCNRCRPMRRCPKCPTEYLFELKVLEDKTVRGFSPERFKQALMVTRWSDLGPGRSPGDPEWAAITGENDEYESFLQIGARAVSGVFESAFTDTIPGQRILSMNPKEVQADETGGNWY